MDTSLNAYHSLKHGSKAQRRLGTGPKSHSQGEAVLAFLCVCVSLELDWHFGAILLQHRSTPWPCRSRPPVSHTHLLDALQTVIGLLDVPIHRIHSGRFAGFYPRAMNVVQPEERRESVTIPDNRAQPSSYPSTSMLALEGSWAPSFILGFSRRRETWGLCLYLFLPSSS